MSETNPTPQLDLLVPWDLLTEHPLNEAERVKITQALNCFLTALKQTRLETALSLTHETLETLEPVESSPAKLSTTKASLKTWEVEDYDRYFQVNHVQTQQPAFCLLKSVIVASQQFLILCLNSQNQPDSNFPKLDSNQIEQQKQGFISYAHLLARLFDVYLEDNP
ncbi:hypothetical protein M595_3286 [Lyngbya aestuarii BL J]|uniref:Uncharacterized protein n=1 Tax=Lyngbya aestuarii BL J TaxID=1348334 RepID=U7QFN9_9CYAN|nr:hypothetical protein [Lyngbya aestuarii]ERT06769.1 hypothetical protein M595_3286 [Lyngbya aestuarii BL J]